MKLSISCFALFALFASTNDLLVLGQQHLFRRERDRQGRGGGRGQGYGAGGGGGGGYGRGGDSPREMIQNLLDNHDMYERTVKRLGRGIRAVTKVKNADSLPDDKVDELTEWLQKHVEQMKSGDYEVRSWDPLFAEIHDNKKDISMKVENIEHGVKVTEKSRRACPAKLIKKHANVVTKFISDGRNEARKSHSVPAACKS